MGVRQEVSEVAGLTPVSDTDARAVVVSKVLVTARVGSGRRHGILVDAGAAVGLVGARSPGVFVDRWNRKSRR